MKYEPPTHVLAGIIAQSFGYKPAQMDRPRSRREAGRMNRAVDLRILGPVKNILEMPEHVQKAARELSARMREKNAG